MTLPVLTTEQRATNLAKAARVRVEKAEIRNHVRTGAITIAAALDIDALKGLKVRLLLTDLPRLGTGGATTILNRTNIPAEKKIGGLGTNQRTALLAALVADGYLPSDG